jgi:16S rRNA (uracil1498-N3)-methyltransferase
MIFLFHESAGESSLQLSGDAFKHMIKARRQSVGDQLILRKLDDNHNYIYTIEDSTKKEATLLLKETVIPPKQERKNLHIGWCMIDPKSIEKVLPSLCELGVDEISFIYANRSQKNFSVDMKRLDRILINSMQQCGRFDKMQLHIDVVLEDFIASNPDSVVLDFCDAVLKNSDHYSSVILGPEGGFDNSEKEILRNLDVRRLDTPMVLRSETAAIAVASKLLL